MAPDQPIERLTKVVERQQRQLEQLKAQHAANLVVELAKGMLVERLGCSPAQASEQLTQLAERSGLALVEFAAEVIGESGTVADGEVSPVQLRLTESALTQSADGAEIADAVFEQALSPLGAQAVAIWLLDPDGTLRMVGQHGLGSVAANRWRQLPPQLESLPQQVVTEGRTLWLASDGRAVLPLRHKRRTLGVMEIRWPAEQPAFVRALRGQLTALADVCANALGLAVGEPAPGGVEPWQLAVVDNLLDSVLIAHAVRDSTGAVVDFAIDHVNEDFADQAGRRGPDVVGRTLLQLYPLAGSASGLFEHAVEVLATGSPHYVRGMASSSGSARTLLDVRVVRMLDGVAITWRPHEQVDLLNHAQRLGRIGGWAENLVTGEIEWTGQMFELFGLARPMSLQSLGEHLDEQDATTVDRFLNTLVIQRRQAAAVFRLPGEDGTVRQLRAFAEPVIDESGDVVAIRGTFQDATTQYHTEFALSATQDQLSRQRRLAIQLQHAIIPPSTRTLEVAGLEVAARYRPAGHEHLVGGDWYDAVALPSGQVLLVVGDMAGHGIDVVTGMISMRHVLRGLAVTGARPAQLLTWLNTSAHSLPEKVSGTVVCGLYDPASSELLWARAGHLPPVLVRDGNAILLPYSPGPMLGAFTDAKYVETTTALRGEDRLVLFTDGLVERPGEDLDECIERLMGTAARVVDDVEVYADQVLDHAAANNRDDTCLLAVKVT